MWLNKNIKTIAFAKIGKSIKFSSAFSAAGGDNEAPQLLRLLANNNPNKKFVIIGRSDFKKLTEAKKAELFPFNNVIDVFEGYSGPATIGIVSSQLKKLGISIDFGIYMIGQIGTVTIPGKIKQIGNPDLIASVIDMTKNYSTPIIEWMNDFNVPFIEIVNDPRYTLRQSRDIIPNPFKTLSQNTTRYVKSTIRSYEDQTRDDHQILMTYNGVENIFCYGRGSPNKSFDRNVNMMIVLNEGNPSRYDFLKEWVLDGIDDISIYGVWDEEKVKGDSRFVGAVQIDELQRKLSNVKFTFIIPIAPGWATSKYIEMIHAGVVPFFHPTYASNVPAIIEKIPEILKPKTPAEFHLSVKKMTETPEAYEKMISYLQKTFCHESLYDGTALNYTVMSSFISDYKQPDLRAFEKVKVNNLEDFFG